MTIHWGPPAGWRSPGGPVADKVLARPCTATPPPATGMADIPDVATDEGWLYLASLEIGPRGQAWAGPWTPA